LKISLHGSAELLQGRLALSVEKPRFYTLKNQEPVNLSTLLTRVITLGTSPHMQTLLSLPLRVGWFCIWVKLSSYVSIFYPISVTF